MPGVRITIADRGCGMSPETLRRIREPFFTTKEGGGTGLGMWVVHELLTKYEGKLHIRTRTKADNQGSTFLYFSQHAISPLRTEWQFHSRGNLLRWSPFAGRIL
jgi:K+-sensing histidine kinase KdpD